MRVPWCASLLAVLAGCAAGPSHVVPDAHQPDLAGFAATLDSLRAAFLSRFLND